MDLLNATKKLFRSSILLLSVMFLAFGSTVLPVSANDADRSIVLLSLSELEATSPIDDHGTAEAHENAFCASQHATASHEDGACCDAMCSAVIAVPASFASSFALSESIAPSFHSMPARSSVVEFFRPPSLTI